jgi:hypothetical protein
MKKKCNPANVLLMALIFCASLHGGDIKLLNKVNLDESNILKPTLFKVYQENIYIYDEGNAAFFILDKEFKVKNTFCKKGDGPSECRKPISFGFQNNRVWVYDAYGKMAFFDLDGTFIEETRTGGQQIISDYIEPGKYFFFENKFDDKSNRIQCLCFLSGSNKIKLAEKQEKIGLVLDLDKRSMVLFDMGKKWSFVVPSNRVYHIERFDMEKMTFSGVIEKKDYQLVRLNEKELAKLKEKVNRLKRENPVLMQYEVKLPTYKPAVNDIYVDEKDRLYLVTNTPEDRLYQVEIYDETLGCKYRFNVPASKWLSPSGNSIFLISQDESEESYWLHQYRLNE